MFLHVVFVIPITPTPRTARPISSITIYFCIPLWFLSFIIHQVITLLTRGPQLSLVKNFTSLTEPVLSVALGIVVAGALALGSFFVLNRFFGLFNYADLSPTQVDKVAMKFIKHAVTKADGPSYSRGVVSMNGVLYYFKHHYGQSFEIFPMVYERYSTDRDLLGAPVLVNPI